MYDHKTYLILRYPSSFFYCLATVDVGRVNTDPSGIIYNKRDQHLFFAQTSTTVQGLMTVDTGKRNIRS